ncbi:hypothetical protein NQ315_000856 [Exocentrus adspersus]|uniref:Uncharacterized protein n=1 Tax=Exocentrus adspersus TaxID=1586481 RepID=A0AAV8WEX7_9CUCU|nr:hypothetical protein NQ315_000856 [Exocentrus adspersus]
MSLSQKHFGRVFVPWFNSAEWKQVYKKLCLQSEENYAEVLNVLKIWKYRTPLLSAGVEGTLILLEALLTQKDNLSEQQLTKIYSISIMRFLNLCATNNEKQGTFYKTAIQNELPKWLINIRHDIAHNHVLPSISVLELGLQQCLEWIKLKYWKVQSEIILDYIAKQEMDNQEITEMLKIYVQLKLNYLSGDFDINDCDAGLIERFRSVILRKTNKPYADVLDTEGLLEIFVSECLGKEMEDNDKELVTQFVVMEVLLHTEIESTPEGGRIIPKSIRDLWFNLLNVLNENNFIFSILKQLLSITSSVELESSIRETAALWINEIFIGLQKTQLLKEGGQVYLLNYCYINCARFVLEAEAVETFKRDSTEMKLAVEEKYPECKDCLEFVSVINAPGTTEVQEFQDKMLNTPNDFTLLFLERVLRFNKNTEDFITDAINLTKRLLLPNEVENDREIYTAEHLGVNINGTSMDRTDSDTTIIVSLGMERGTRRWKRVENAIQYKGCPLGLLPHQSRDKNPLLRL